jgi:membrane-associated protease RseP (regulator of RpoE activity)
MSLLRLPRFARLLAAGAGVAVAFTTQIVKAEDPQTRPTVIRRALVWDRVRNDVELTKQRAELEKAAYLGVASSPATPVLRRQLKLAEGVGLVVDYVEPGSPAQAAGLQPYDVAVRLNDQILVNPPQLAVLVRTFEPGDVVTLTVIREGKSTPVNVKLAERNVKPIGEIAFGPVVSDVLINEAPAATRPAGENAAAAAAAPRAAVGDVVDVTVFDLEGPGLQTKSYSVITASGEIRLPLLDQSVAVRGKTEVELRRAIRDAYQKANVLENANVSVTLTPRIAAQPTKGRREGAR